MLGPFGVSSVTNFGSGNSKITLIFDYFQCVYVMVLDNLNMLNGNKSNIYQFVTANPPNLCIWENLLNYKYNENLTKEFK